MTPSRATPIASGCGGKPADRCGTAPTEAGAGKVEADAALRAFIDARLGRMSLERLARIVRGRFGPDAPGYTGLRRYIKRRRRAVSADRTAEIAP